MYTKSACVIYLVRLNKSGNPVYLTFFKTFCVLTMFIYVIILFQEAAEAIAFYHRIAINSKQMEIEIRKLKLQLDPKIIKMLDSGGEGWCSTISFILC